GARCGECLAVGTERQPVKARVSCEWPAELVVVRQRESGAARIERVVLSTGLQCIQAPELEIGDLECIRRKPPGSRFRALLRHLCPEDQYNTDCAKGEHAYEEGDPRKYDRPPPRVL